VELRRKIVLFVFFSCSSFPFAKVINCSIGALRKIIKKGIFIMLGARLWIQINPHRYYSYRRRGWCIRSHMQYIGLIKSRSRRREMVTEKILVLVPWVVCIKMTRDQARKTTVRREHRALGLRRDPPLRTVAVGARPCFRSARVRAASPSKASSHFAGLWHPYSSPKPVGRDQAIGAQRGKLQQLAQSGNVRISSNLNPSAAPPCLAIG